MPELPEVETMRRGVARLVGLRIIEASVPQLSVHPIKYVPSATAICRGLRGRILQEAGRAGKRLLLHLDSGHVLVIEPRMTGRVIIDPLDELSHVRLVLTLEDTSGTQPRKYHRLLYRDVRGLGVIRLMTWEECRIAFGPDNLGPDALSISWQELRSRLSKRRSAIKVALLDQTVLAGVGNIYASEALHRAKIHPALPCSALRPNQWQTLKQAINEVLEEAIEHQGSTLKDGAYNTPDNRKGDYQDKHRVYQRDGQRCLRCRRGIIRRIILGQRSTFFCPICQRLPKRLSL